MINPGAFSLLGSSLVIRQSNPQNNTQALIQAREQAIETLRQAFNQSANETNVERIREQQITIGTSLMTINNNNVALARADGGNALEVARRFANLQTQSLNRILQNLPNISTQPVSNQATALNNEVLLYYRSRLQSQVAFYNNFPALIQADGGRRADVVETFRSRSNEAARNCNEQIQQFSTTRTNTQAALDARQRVGNFEGQGIAIAYLFRSMQGMP